MTLVETLAPRGEPELVDAHLAFQLQAGVDLVLVSGEAAPDEVREVLERHAESGRVRVVAQPPAELAHLAATDHGAEWILEGRAEEFWWPRGESLGAILAAIPGRYTAVQGLVRPLVPGEEGAGPVIERATLRRPVVTEAGEDGAAAWLEAVRRPASGRGRPVPLRGWYPIEIFRVSGQPLQGGEQGAGALVEDTRLRDALRGLRAGTELSFPVPDVVDDAAYAVECAAVGEVDLDALDRRIDELETKIAQLERTFWTRARARASRLARPRRRPRR